MRCPLAGIRFPGELCCPLSRGLEPPFGQCQAASPGTARFVSVTTVLPPIRYAVHRFAHQIDTQSADGTLPSGAPISGACNRQNAIPSRAISITSVPSRRRNTSPI